jgi:hypothetical protein
MDRRATARREEDHGLKALESGRRVTTRLQPRQSR